MGIPNRLGDVGGKRPNDKLAKLFVECVQASRANLSCTPVNAPSKLMHFLFYIGSTWLSPPSRIKRWTCMNVLPGERRHSSCFLKFIMSPTSVEGHYKMVDGVCLSVCRVP